MTSARLPSALPEHPGSSAPDATRPIVVFHLDGRRFALHLGVVERVVPTVEIQPLPQAPAIVLGVINVEGRIIPVVDIRARFSIPRRAPTLSDHLLIAQTQQRSVGIVVDAVVGVTHTTEIVAPGRFLENAACLAGVAKLNGDLIFIHDLDTFLSAAESAALEVALDSNGRS